MNDNNNNNNLGQENQDGFVDLRPSDPMPNGQAPPSPASHAPYVPPPTPPARKRRWPLILAIVLGVLIASNIATSVFNIRIGNVHFTGFSSFFPNSSNTTSQSFSVNELQHLSVSMSTSRIEMGTHNGNDIRVTFTPPSTGQYIRPDFNFNPNTGRLEITQRGTLVSIGAGNFGGGTLSIDLPRNNADTLDTIDLLTTTGRIVADNFTANRVDISTTTGRIDIGNITSLGNLTANATTGRIEANRLHADGYIRLTTSTGRIEASNIVTQRSFEARSTTGRIELSNIDSRNVDANATTGRIVASRIEANGDMTLTTTTGRIELNRLDVTGNLRAQATTGRVEITNSDIAGSMTLRTTTGRVNMSNVNTDMNRANIDTNRNTRVNIR
ncbi:MAG: DUF4097 domain-containing protein [Defluviitaleaceae bacterium]|nr:DUF4097 domain-containing protein [Defluviitaleaceae bacterium]